MNNKLLMDNYLLVLKSTVEVYVHGTLESSNDDVRENLKYGLDRIMTCQAETYNKMTNLGYYSVNNVDDIEISKTLNKIMSKN